MIGAHPREYMPTMMNVRILSQLVGERFRMVGADPVPVVRLALRTNGVVTVS